MPLRPASKPAAFLLHIGALLFLLALGYAFFAPPRSAPPLTYFGAGGDPLSFIWFLNWWPFAAQHHLPLFHTSYVNAPFGENLAWRAGVIGLGLLAAPFTLKFGALAVYNTLMLAAPGLSGWGAYLAAHELSEDTAASLTAGLVFGFCNYMLGHLLGHLNLCLTFAIPFCLWACLAAAKHGWGKWRLALLLGLALAFEFGVSQELYATLLIFGALAAATLYALHPPARAALARLLPGVSLGIGASLVILSPLIWQMLRSYAGGSHSVASPADFSVDLLGFILPTPITWLGGHWLAPLTNKFTGNTAEDGNYISLPLLLLLAHIARTHRTAPAVRVLAGFAALACLLALGPYVHVMGAEISTAPWLPASVLPFLHAMLPARFMLYAWLAIALLLACWLAAPGRKAPRYVLLAACLVFILPARGYERNWPRLPIPAVFTNGAIPPGSRILILPENQVEMGYQYAAGMRFSMAAQGYLGTGAPLPFARWPLYRALFLQKYQASLPLINPPMLAAFLAQYGVQTVVVTGGFPPGHTPAPTSAAVAALLQRAGWLPAAPGADAQLFHPPATNPPPDAAQLAAFMRMPAPEQRGLNIRLEQNWVHAIRLIARFTGLNPAPLLAFYAAHAHPPLPVDTIR